MEKIQTKTHAVSKDENGIIHLEVIEGAHVDTSSIKELHTIYKQLAGNNKMLLLVNAHVHYTMTGEATEYLKTNLLDKDRLATAIISTKLGVRITVDSFKTMLKAKSQVKMFADKQEAMEWLLTF
ncbi:MAG TPA: hypothetical protein VNZ45_00640 [Bacteroidia bacterium]|jgi:hypothetical protein|nr:hypothetical protein [Bacteroidia bacterium]